MNERRRSEPTRDACKAYDQAIADNKRIRRSGPIAAPMRIVKESLFEFGNETEPFTEEDIDALIAEYWGPQSKGKKRFVRRQHLTHPVCKA